MKVPVVVSGVGMVTPLGVSTESSWKAFTAGSSGLRPVTLFDASRWPSGMGGEVDTAALEALFTPGEIARHDRATLLLFAAAREALQQAGLEKDSDERRRRTALLLGSTLGGMPSATAYLRQRETENDHSRIPITPLREMLVQHQAHETCRRWGFEGESLVVSDACTSGTNALGFGLRLLRRGDADVVVAGGFDPFSEFSFAGFHSLLTIAPDVPRPFDQDRKGLQLGEGAAVMILEREPDARARGAAPLGRILGYGESADAHHITRPDPTARGAVLAIRRALKDAAVDPDDIDHVNTHGTGTPTNDAMEAKAIREVFGDRATRLPVTSLKGTIGHSLGAAGAVEAAVTLLSLRDGLVPPTLHHENLAADCDGIDVVSGDARRGVFRHALSNSFGFGGSNAAIVLSAP